MKRRRWSWQSLTLGAALGAGFTIKTLSDGPIGALRLVDPKTGKIVWKLQTGSGKFATPITWSEGGKQYVAAASGWGGGVPLWGGRWRQEGPLPVAGRFGLGLQEPKVSSGLRV